jgi:hypothetical protein
MRSSDEVRARAELTILRIARLLDQKRLDELVHDPIDHARASFQPEADPITDWRQFHSEIAAFLGHLHRGGIPALRPVLRPLDHAIALLDQHYVGPYASGYHAALLDAIDPERGGIEPVLIRIGRGYFSSGRKWP